jgi:Asp-tRNA(Asn)/Glu-tRNA(Gln) amidotransferase A subunit family amidase
LDSIFKRWEAAEPELAAYWAIGPPYQGRAAGPMTRTVADAASVNCGYTASGLPIGLQMIARSRDDSEVMQLSHAYEKMWPRLGKKYAHDF